jgi:hypothetical protein
MKSIGLALGGAAFLALCGVFATVPGHAQESDEAFATRALNTLAEREAAAAARVDAAERRDVTRSYQANLREHEEAKEEVAAIAEAQADAYARELDEYAKEKQKHARDQLVHKEDIAQQNEKQFEILTFPGQRLSQLSRVDKAELIGKQVKDEDGKLVGFIDDVEIPTIIVKLGSGPRVAVNSPRLRYDLDTHVVISDVERSDIEKFPRAVTVLSASR